MPPAQIRTCSITAYGSDDWGLAAFTDVARRDLLEIFDDRHELRSTLVTSQLPVEHWHDNLGDPTLAGAILPSSSHISISR